MKTYTLTYTDEKTILEAWVAQDDSIQQPRPLVLVFHDWTGRNEFACQKAQALAELGYIGVAVDMYGQGKIGHTNEEKLSYMKPLIENRLALQKRARLAFNLALTIQQVDPARIAAIGFCFGGLCALDLARSGAALRGVVSFHGLLTPSAHAEKISAKVLALHGHDDPMVPLEQVQAFQTEMTQAKVDWEMHIYGHTQHAFTNPAAQDSTLGTVYNRKAEQRAWSAMKLFFEDIFSH